MNKLIATHFAYTTVDTYGKRRTEQGSYLGRVTASPNTIRRFINGNIKHTGAQLTLRGVTLGASYTSQWIAK